ncbi:MAG TPA: TonB-dependent receptor [Rhizomicrobium sp.]|nr:TonB-dependent receptor [Rhizomicrobium sp.]
MSFIRLHIGAVAVLAAIVITSRAQAHGYPETVVVTAERTPADVRYQPPSKTETVTADEAAVRINAVNTEDLLRYLPDILVRKRHYGDTQDPITTRTSGVGASARSLIYADGILLSTLIGNNNGTASPHWGLVAPEEINQIDVLYGPFAAAYPGNSIGAVVNITTHMPDAFGMNAKAVGAVQSFSQYGTEGDYGTYQFGAGIGDRIGDFAWRLGLNHLDSESQPLAYVTLTRPATPSGAGTPVTGAFADVNRTGAPIAVLGAGGFEHQMQDNATLKLAYDLPGATLLYTFGLFHQNDSADVQTYLRNAAGDAVWSGSVNIGGYKYAIPASAFSNNLYHLEQTHMIHGLSLKSDGGGAFEWEAVASLYDFATDKQRLPTVAVPLARTGGAGSIVRLDGTGWYTLDAKGIWHAGDHDVSFGVHRDQYTLRNQRFSTANWLTGSEGALASVSRGTTATNALWVQDVWSFAPMLKATVGLRFEDWHAYDGVNFSLTPALNVKQPELAGSYFSPKASLAWTPASDWRITASFGEAYRMPTVGELYQAITTGATLSVPNPDLKPERALSTELSAEHNWTGGRVRVSLFEEDLANALLSQSAPLVAGSTTLFNFVQNVEGVRSRGAEIVLDQNDVLVEGLDLSGSLTYVDSRITRDTAFAAAVGKYTPSIPKLRATASATWHPDDKLALTLGLRYSDRVWATIDNSDVVTHTWQGFDPYFVVDLRAHYEIDDHWSASVGVDNINNDKYFLFHPFPQRTFLVDLHYAE